MVISCIRNFKLLSENIACWLLTNRQSVQTMYRWNYFVFACQSHGHLIDNMEFGGLFGCNPFVVVVDVNTVAVHTRCMRSKRISSPSRILSRKDFCISFNHFYIPTTFYSIHHGTVGLTNDLTRILHYRQRKRYH
jgi:hypothetical protein